MLQIHRHLSSQKNISIITVGKMVVMFFTVGKMVVYIPYKPTDIYIYITITVGKMVVMFVQLERW